MCMRRSIFSVQKGQRLKEAIIMLLLLLCLTACSGNPSSINQNIPIRQQTRILTNRINPCSLISKAQVEQVVSMSVIETQPQGYMGTYTSADTCSFEGPNPENLSIGVSIDLYTYSDSSQAQANLQRISATFSGHSVKGPGNLAILTSDPPILYVQQDNGIVSVAVVGDDPTTSVKQEQQLAQFAVQNM